jgi:hypothetical protein
MLGVSRRAAITAEKQLIAGRKGLYRDSRGPLHRGEQIRNTSKNAPMFGEGGIEQ